MEHSEQVRLLRILMEQLDTDTNADAGCMRRNPASAYTCPNLAEREWSAFFRGHPQLVGLSGDLPGAGSFLTRDDWGVPILATRDKEGRFHAFLNACRHRGARVESEERGERARFSCPQLLATELGCVLEEWRELGLSRRQIARQLLVDPRQLWTDQRRQVVEGDRPFHGPWPRGSSLAGGRRR